MKPSEIAARLAEIEALAKPLRDQLQPLNEQAEALRQQKAAVVNEYGVKIRRVRDESKLKSAEFVAWRNAILAMPEDDRAAAIDAKLTEVGLA